MTDELLYSVWRRSDCKRKYRAILGWQWYDSFFIVLLCIVNTRLLGLAVLSALITLVFIRPLTNDGMEVEDRKVSLS